MTCLWQNPTSKDSDTARLCGKEGHPFCKEHQFVVEVLAETESVTREICAQAGELAPTAFVKRIHELLPELHRAAMAAVVYMYRIAEPNSCARR